MRLHVVSLPHTQTTRGYDFCAYTAKVRRFASMMHDRGHEVYLYSGLENEARCTEHVAIVDGLDQHTWFPDYNPLTDVWDGFQLDAPWWREMNQAAVDAIHQRFQPGDAICLIAGVAQAPIAESFAAEHAFIVEFGIGYAGVFAPYRVYESYAWMHFLAGRDCGRSSVFGEPENDDVRNYDAVIPNAFDPAEFSISSSPDDYLLYLGRMTDRKGLPVVEEIARRGHRVITAGQGDGRVPAAAEHRGVVLGDEKRALLAHAKAVLVPTTYLEPFGGVAVEAMMSGTPVITTDWGAFTETVAHGLTGFRCRTLGEFLGAIDAAPLLDRHEIRRHAVNHYSTDVVSRQYDRYFAQIEEGNRAGWYTEQGRMRSGIFSRYLR